MLSGDGDWVTSLQVDLANDPEKFSEWEHSFIDSLGKQVKRDVHDFRLTTLQRATCQKIQAKADQ